MEFKAKKGGRMFQMIDVSKCFFWKIVLILKNVCVLPCLLSETKQSEVRRKKDEEIVGTTCDLIGESVCMIIKVRELNMQRSPRNIPKEKANS